MKLGLEMTSFWVIRTREEVFCHASGVNPSSFGVVSKETNPGAGELAYSSVSYIIMGTWLLICGSLRNKPGPAFYVSC